MSEIPVSAKRPRTSVSISFDRSEMRTKQSFKQDADVNKILERFEKTGVLTNVNLKNPQYGIVPSIDFQTAMNIVTTGQQTFEQLPSEIRKRFGNSPEAFFDFVLDPDNHDELVDLGLATEPETASQPETPAEPVPAEPEPAPPA